MENETHLVPWPVVRLPLGQMEAHPRRLQDEHGTVLSHLSLRRRHSAQDMAPLARLSSCSWLLAVRSLSPSLRAAERGIVGEGGEQGIVDSGKGSRWIVETSSRRRGAGGEDSASAAWHAQEGVGGGKGQDVDVRGDSRPCSLLPKRAQVACVVPSLFGPRVPTGPSRYPGPAAHCEDM